MSEFQVNGTNTAALFTLKLHRGEGMCLVAMNWKTDKPPNDFVGFAIEYKEPSGDKFFALKNRVAFPDAAGGVNPTTMSTRLSPIQKFRWVHFPRERRNGRCFHVQSDARVHEPQRRAELRRTTDR